MIGIKFDEMHSYDLYGLKLVSVKNPIPEKRLNQIEVPGRHGKLDYSTALTGDVVYENRQLEYLFDLRAHTLEAYEEKFHRITNDLEGTVRKVYPDKEPDFFYIGRISITGQYDPEGIDHEVTIMVDADPL